ncbi:MAG TPA: TetR/AcrR family transcriptional regulator [Solirubrobacterales bacterium]|nr:TetR/AcrR family transcriptional regulator [Solirubrobacterales bacterium]
MTRTAVEEASRYAHGRVPREVRERQVLEIAEDLFAERGYEGASMDELARRAGVSKPVIYGLVGSKDELYRRSFERAAAELEDSVRAAIAGHEGISERLEAGALAFFTFIAGHRAAWSRLFLEAGGPAVEHVARIRARQAGLVATLVAESAGDDDGRRLGAVSNAVNSGLEGMAAWWREHPDVPPERMTAWALDLFLPGLEALTR